MSSNRGIPRTLSATIFERTAAFDAGSEWIERRLCSRQKASDPASAQMSALHPLLSKSRLSGHDHIADIFLGFASVLVPLSWSKYPTLTQENPARVI